MILETLFNRKYQNLNEIQISSSKLLANYIYLSSIQKKIKIAPVLKSNAYGHGLVLTAKILEKCHAPFFCCDSLFEGYELLKAGIKTKILIMGYTNPLNFSFKEVPFSFAVYDWNTLKAINKYQEEAEIFIFVDTGMNREGVKAEDLAEFLKEAKDLKNIKITGLMSHLAMAGKLNHKLTGEQLKKFIEAEKTAKKWGIKFLWRSIVSSSALLTDKKNGKNLGNLARIGLGLYGIDLFNDNHLQPVLEMRTTLTQIKKVKSREYVGYDFSYKARKNMTIGILSAGYNDGIDRRLAGKGGVYIDDVFCPYAGKISMNLSAVDISKVNHSKVGDHAIVYSADQKKKNTIKKSAKICNTIPYEILIHLNKEIKRVVV